MGAVQGGWPPPWPGTGLAALATGLHLGCVTALLAFGLGKRVEYAIETWTGEGPRCLEWKRFMPVPKSGPEGPSEVPPKAVNV